MGAMLQEITYEDIMNVNIEEAKKQVTQQVKQQERDKGIASIVNICKKMHGSIVDAVETVVSGYGYTEQETEKLIKNIGNC